MSTRLTRTFLFLFAVLAVSAFGGSSDVKAADMKLEAILIWGTNDSQPTDSKIKPVDAALDKKLKGSPFKWKNYFEVNRKDFALGQGKQKVEMSKQCEIQIENLGKVIEVELFGKGKSAGKVKQPLPKGEILVIGGNAENTTSWFVVLKRVE